MKIPQDITDIITKTSDSLRKLFKIIPCKPICNLNKCDYCDLQRTIHPTTKQQIEKLDKWFADINCLYNAKLIPNKYSKSILLPEQTTSYCLINSKYWHKKHKKCPFWQATIGASPDSAMTIHLTRTILRLTLWIFGLSVLMVLIALASFFSSMWLQGQQCP
jgi:hypothetical protein